MSYCNPKKQLLIEIKNKKVRGNIGVIFSTPKYYQVDKIIAIDQPKMNLKSHLNH